MELVISRSEDPGPEAQRVEIVERKGLGHPDSICDALAEALNGAPALVHHAELSRWHVELLS